jgi:MOSC domain-containing protein YiiM
VEELAVVGTTPSLVSVNVGLPRQVQWRGRVITTGIWKAPVAGGVAVRSEHLDGDAQADLRVHGGPDKAVYAYAVEDYAWWAGQLGRELSPGTFGENLTTTGLDLLQAAVGDRWHVGDAVLEVSQPREPCYKLGIRMGDDGFPLRFRRARRPGAYLRVIRTGTVTAGDRVRVEPATPPVVRLADLVADRIRPQVLELAAADQRLPAPWRDGAADALRDDILD